MKLSNPSKGWVLVAGLVVVAAAALNAFAVFAPAAPTASAPLVGAGGPDVIVGDLYDLRVWGNSNDGNYRAYSVGTVSCNIGDMDLDWFSSNNRHPVIGQNLYRYHEGRFSMIGRSWLKHGFAALDGNLCDTCSNPPGSSTLGVGCSDPYSGGLNGSQGNLGPRSEVNAFNGVFAYPFGNPPVTDTSSKRIRVALDDLDSSLYPGARYFVEGHYVTQDDAQWGNGDNNVSYRDVAVTGSRPSYGLSFSIPGTGTSSTVRKATALSAWKRFDGTVSFRNVRIPNEGLLVFAHNTTDNGNGTWRYEYALFNMNSDRSVRAFGVPVDPGSVTISGQDQHVLPYHSGEPYLEQSWKQGNRMVQGTAYQFWAARRTFNQNPDSNALRWSSLANFGFDADSPPATVQCGIQIFKPGTPNFVFFDGAGPQ